ncbi:MAG: putative baseplate assembly protein [Acidobacteriota bacterium]|nr:putative baseplate assembly protein [Acidobacteriota bacterium]
MAARYYCGDEERRARVRATPGIDGIDFLEVLDTEAPDALAQKLLAVRLLDGPVPALSAENVRIEGGVRVTAIEALWAMPLPDVAGAPGSLVTNQEKNFLAAHFAAEAEPQQILMVRTSARGDFSRYRLVLVEPVTGEVPPVAGFDPRLSAVDFSFKVECPSDFDCKSDDPCPPEELTEPPIDYLAKDYGSFRRLLFDRLSVTAPEWQERNPADLGVALVELMAYVGDRLSYFQDAVATEAYLGTARRRASVRRHARLTDYFLHEGVNARTFVAFDVGAGAAGAVLPGANLDAGTAGTAVLTRSVTAEGATLPPAQLNAAAGAGAVIFETLADLELHPELGEIHLYTWSDRECCLPVGATAATLLGPLPTRGVKAPTADDPEPSRRSHRLQGPPLSDEGLDSGLGEGDFLLFEEILGPDTGAAADADPAHRHIVRLTGAVQGVDPLDGTEVVEVTWDAADALPFPLCISGRTDAAHGSRYLEGVSVARGNLVPADHGHSLQGTDLPPVPEDDAEGAPPYRPVLEEPALTFAAALPGDYFSHPEDPDPPAVLAPAVTLADFGPAEAKPQLRLVADGEVWQPRRDLLESGAFARELVVEMEEDRRARLRFGDGEHGRRPLPGTVFSPRYRAGNGLVGNLGADALTQVVTTQGGIRGVRNPLPAAGGQAPEPLEDVRQYAPQAFRKQLRAVTAADYAEVSERHPEVDRAAATFRWTGSWYTVFVTVDRKGGLAVDSAFEDRLREHLGFFRLAGYDLEVDGPRFVPLDVELGICLRDGYLRTDVGRELRRVFSNRLLPDGRRGFFHPDAWTFQQPVYLSPIVAAASAVEGVASVTVRRFRRWGRPPEGEIGEGVLDIGRLEIAQLDNDPNFPENGRLVFRLGGGA